MCNKIYNSFSIFLLRRTRKTLLAYTHNAQTDETLEYHVRQSEKLELTKDSVGGIHGKLFLGYMTNHTMSFSESHIRWCRSVPQFIGNDFPTWLFCQTATHE